MRRPSAVRPRCARVAIALPPLRAPSFSRASLAARFRAVRPRVRASSPGVVNVRILTLLIAAGIGGRGQRATPREASCIARPARASISSVPGNTGRRGKWSAKYAASPTPGTCSVARCACREHDRSSRVGGAGTPLKRSGAAPRVRSVSKSPARSSGHRTRPSAASGRRSRSSSIDRSAVDAGAPAIGHRFGVATFDVGLEPQRSVRARRSLVIARLAGQAGHGPPGEVDVRHRHTTRPAAPPPRPSATPGSVSRCAGTVYMPSMRRAGSSSRDAVDECERAKAIAHAAAASARALPQAAACAVRCARTTTLQNVSGVNRRGMSAAFSGVLNRSAGTSLRNSFSRASPASVTMPLLSNSASGSVAARVLDDLAARNLHLERRARAGTRGRESRSILHPDPRSARPSA